MLQITVEEKVKSYPKLYYTTDMNALKFILGKLTLRSSSLTYARLNDQLEQKRVGVEQFAGARFITCFCHANEEDDYFWNEYGGDDPSRKILLQFRNFSRDISAAIHTDFCIREGNEKVLFNSHIKNVDDFHNVNMSNTISKISMFDVEYRDKNSPELTQDYSDRDISNNNESQKNESITLYDARCLGRYKSREQWEREKESRIMLSLNKQNFNDWDYVDLRLKEEIFRDLIIVMSPWATIKVEEELKDLFVKSPINDGIKNTIRIEHSKLSLNPDGTL